MKYIFILACLIVISIKPTSSQSQTCTPVGYDQVTVGNAAGFIGGGTSHDLVHIRNFNATKCSFPASGVRFDYDDLPYFGQLCIVNGTRIASSLAVAGDVVLRASCDAKDLILTEQSSTGAIRFGTASAIYVCPSGGLLYPSSDLNPIPPSWETERMTILNNGKIGINQSSPTQLCEIRNGNFYLSHAAFTSPDSLRLQGDSTGTTTFVAGPQSSTNITYRLPTASPAANSLLFSSGGATSNLSWSNTGTTDQILTISGGIPSWQSPASIASFVRYNVTSSQSTATLATVTPFNYLFNVGYATSTATTDALGAVITSISGTTGTTSATGLAITATAHGSGTSTGLNVNVGSGTGGTNFAALFTGGNVGVQTSNPKSTLQVDNISIQSTTWTPSHTIGTYGAISYNNFWDESIPGPVRLANGPVSGVGFEPWLGSGTNDGLSHGSGRDGSIYLFAQPNGTVADNVEHTLKQGASLVLRPYCATSGQGPGELILEMWNSAGAYPNIFDYQFPTWNSGGTAAKNDGHFFINDQVIIGRMTPLATTTTPPFGGIYMLGVNGSILAKELVIDARSASWSDFVFDPSYKLPTLQEVEKNIISEHHLSGIPSAIEVEKNGIVIGEMQSKLLQKIEELTLYVIQLQKENEHLSQRIENIEKIK